MHTHVALLRGVNNLGSKKVTMAELRQVASSLGHASVMTYIQSGNVLFTPRPAGGAAPGCTGTAALAAELERAIADGTGVRARAVVLSCEDLARTMRDNPYPDEPGCRAAGTNQWLPLRAGRHHEPVAPGTSRAPAPGTSPGSRSCGRSWTSTRSTRPGERPSSSTGSPPTISPP